MAHAQATPVMKPRTAAVIATVLGLVHAVLYVLSFWILHSVPGGADTDQAVLGYYLDPTAAGSWSPTLTVPRAALAHLATGDLAAARSAGPALDGDASAVDQLTGVLDPGDSNFSIIEP